MSKKIELKALVDGETAILSIGKPTKECNEKYDWVSLAETLCGEGRTIQEQTNALNTYMEKHYDKIGHPLPDYEVVVQ